MCAVKQGESIKFWLIIAAIMLACVLASQVKAQEPTNLEPYNSIAQITVQGMGQGSGYLIATREDLGVGLGVTCRHVALKQGQAMLCDWLWAGAGQTVGRTLAVVKGTDFSTDLAVFVTELPRGIKPLRVVPFNPATGPWVAAGYRAGVLRTAGPVDIANYNGSTIATKNVFVGGMSGGPMFNRYGEPVGVVVASDGNNFSLCSDGPALTALIQRFLITESASEFRGAQ